MPTTYEYPKILTDADWQKHKGIIAKLSKATKETGLGAQLKTLKQAYDNVDWDKFDTASCNPDRMKNIEDIEGKKQEAADEYKRSVVKLRQELTTTQSLATKVAQEFEKHKLIPKSSREHVEKIAEAAKQMHLDLKDSSIYFTAVMKAFDDFKESRRKQEARQLEIANVMAKSYYEKIKSMAPAVMKNPTPEEWATYWKEAIRGLGTALAKHPDKEVQGWYEKNYLKQFTSNAYSVAKAEEIPGRLKAVLSAVQQIQPKIK